MGMIFGSSYADDEPAVAPEPAPVVAKMRGVLHCIWGDVGGGADECFADVAIGGRIERTLISVASARALLAAWGPPPRKPMDVEVTVGLGTVDVYTPGCGNSIELTAPVATASTPTTPAPRHGTIGAIQDAVVAATCPGCPNVDGVELDVTREPSIRLTVKGRGVTDDELAAIRAAAVGAVSIGVDVVVVRAETVPNSLSSLVASTTQQILRSVAMRPAEPAAPSPPPTSRPAPAPTRTRTPCPPGSRVERVAAALHRAYYRGDGPFSQASPADREHFAAIAAATLDGPAETPAPPAPREGEPGTKRGDR